MNLIQKDDAPIQNNPLRIQVLPDKTVVDFYMPEVIDGVADFIDFLRAVQDARNNDDIILHINCYGGRVDTAFNIIDVLKETQGNVHISIEGACMSAASMIALAGDSWDIMPHSFFMVHAYTAIHYGKRQEIIASTDFDKKWLDASFREIYGGFLTEAEIEKCLNGEDFYFTAEETTKRIKNYKKEDFDRQDAVNKVIQKYQKSINDEIQKALDDFDKKGEKIVKKEKKK